MKNGILIIDKPEGITSAKAVLKIKELLKLNKAGHAGTLDPFATGILMVCLNRATKIAKYLSDLDKEYITTMVLGISTDTQDLKGKIIKINTDNAYQLNYSNIEKVFNKFQKDIWQIPPMFSAVRHQGRRLYKLARKGIKINLAPRKVKIHKIKILAIKYDCFPSITFQVHCSKGTYIRTLCNDIGEALGFGAYVSHLRRIRVGHYDINQSVDLNNFIKMPSAERDKYILPVDNSLSHLKKIILPENKEIIERIKNGGYFSEAEFSEKISEKKSISLIDKYAVYSSEGNLLAIAEKLKQQTSNKNIYKVEKVFT